MPSGYNEIPGVYSETPRPLAAARRTFRNYRRCLTGTGMVLIVILFAVMISIFVGREADDSAEEEDTKVAEPQQGLTSPQEGLTSRQKGLTSPQQGLASTENGSLNALLSLTWPRRDEVWYKRRWEKTHMKYPFQSRPSSSSHTISYAPKLQRTKRALDHSGKNGDDSDSEYSEIDDHEEDYDVGEDFLKDSHDDDVDMMEEDGSTFPPEDTFNWNRNASFLPECTVKNIGEAMAEGSRIENRKMDLEEDLMRRNISLKKFSPSFYHQKAFRKTSPIAWKMSHQGFRMDHASKSISKMLKLNVEDTIFDSRWLGDLSESPYCDYNNVERLCSGRNAYRTPDGSCNNLKHPSWGASFTPFRRAMAPDYADGVLQPRRGKDGQGLPSARLVSMTIHRYRRISSHSYTLLTMVMGQFIDHDITATAQAQSKNGTSLSCCHEEVLKDRSLSHPECLEIYIPPEDSFYRSKNVTCMEFSRSAPSPRCLFGPREQFNQNTHFLDGSGIYGSSEEAMNKLRTHKEGFLRTQVTLDGRQLLPSSLNPNDSCNTEQQMKWKQHCFVAGDSRVNEHIHLTIMHTVWARQHNLIAEELRDINPHWDDEKMFQETRKIIIAQLQHITYHEYLPSILGPHLSYGLYLSPSSSGTYWKGYSSKIHPGIANGFAAGAFRFGHSMIQGLMQSVDRTGKNVKYEQISRYFFNPFVLYDLHIVANMIRGQVSQKAAAVDTYFSKQVTQRLFQKGSSDHGLDLAAINIQRGRDHGIPGYTRWRMMCGLPVVHNFTDLSEDMDAGALEAIEKVYRSVDEIDLYSGGLAEKPVKDGLVGPTFACIIADQFLRLKKGDRFWYENGPGPESFTKDQLLELRKTSLARILCSSIIELGSIQRWPLRKFETENPRLSCSSRSIPKMSLGPWEDEAVSFGDT